MIFKPHEIAYLRKVQLGRLATIQANGTPQVSPVGFIYNENLQTIDIGGYRMSQSQKFRNIATNDKVAFVVDDIASRDPWRVRCLEIRGVAEQATSDGQRTGAAGDALDSAIIRIRPRRVISFGIDDTDTEPHLLRADTRNVTPAGGRDSGHA
jgi:pyridoxamine 5'-phosphate oxidase family protein